MRQALPVENTIAAFERALADGADGFELDVRMCASGELVVLHDKDLGRVTEGRDARAVHEVRLSDLPRVGVARPPTLEEVLELCVGTGALLNVELKYDVPDRALSVRRAAATLRTTRARVLVSCFDPRMLLGFGALCPKVPRAWLTSPDQRAIALSIAAFARSGPLFAVHLERRQASPRRVAMLLGRGLRVGVWTVNEGDEARALFALGVSWVISDAPHVVRAAIAQGVSSAGARTFPARP
jgi:glycerophosphoryl diester phosphodiesterase